MTDRDVSPARPLVLLLENEPLQMLTLVDFIEEAGCEAVHVHDAATVIRLLETRPEIRVVVADLDVRGSPMGMKLAALIRDRWPPVELMLTGSVRPAPATLPARGHFFDKPFDQRGFEKALRAFTGTGPASAP